MISYRVAVIRQVTNALRRTFDDGFPDEKFRGMYVGPEFQMDRTRYPSIIVRYNETSLQNMGLGHFLTTTDENGSEQRYYQWLFKGSLILTVFALNQYERDLVMDRLVFAIGPGKHEPGSDDLFNELYDDDFVILNANMESIQPGGTTVNQAPWGNENDFIHSGQYSLDVTGEFFSQITTSELVPINQINVYPYRPDQAVPIGSDPTDNWE